MTKVEKPKKKLDFDPDKCEKLYEDLVETFTKSKSTVAEILVALSNLTYTLGASIEGYEDTGPGLDTLQKMYYADPGRIGVALMLQGFTMATWYDDYKRQLFDKTQERVTDED